MKPCRTFPISDDLVRTAVEQHLRSLSLINDNEFVAEVVTDHAEHFHVNLEKE